MDTRLIVLLEKVRDALGVEPVEGQAKAATSKKETTSKAKAALQALKAKSKAGQTKDHKVQATGAAKK